MTNVEGRRPEGAPERAAPDELQELLLHGMQKAGAVKLVTPELIATLADHARATRAR
jgi:hypothetical protein